jgi:hypothetical protein
MKLEDIVDVLKPCQVDELNNIANEPYELDTVNEDEYKEITAEWRLKCRGKCRGNLGENFGEDY